MSARRSLVPPLALAVMAISMLVGIYLGNTGNTGVNWGSAPAAIQPVLWPEPMRLEDFDLVTHHGEAFGRESFRGGWDFVFFGYLGCPDVCPTSLHAMRDFRGLLENGNGAGTDTRFLFVTVDPERDRPESMGPYLSWFDPEFIGLYGPRGEIERIARSMSVRYLEVIDADGNRSIDHTSSVMIVDPAGRVVGAFPPPLIPERMAEQFAVLREYLRK